MSVTILHVLVSLLFVIGESQEEKATIGGAPAISAILDPREPPTEVRSIYVEQLLKPPCYVSQKSLYHYIREQQYVDANIKNCDF